MANGYAKVKDINDKGIVLCSAHDTEIKRNANDINEIGKKIGRVYWIAITILLSLIVNLIVILSKKP